MANEHPPYATVYKPFNLWEAIILTWDPELQRYVPWQTSQFAYPNREMAVEEAKEWAEAEEIEYKDEGEA